MSRVAVLLLALLLAPAPATAQELVISVAITAAGYTTGRYVSSAGRNASLTFVARVTASVV